MLLNICRLVIDGLLPVSYTHLIVVKNLLDRIITEFIRQNHDNTRNRILNSVSLIIGITGILVSVIMACVPVSYTHLDVYKRQPLHYCRDQGTILKVYPKG